MDNLNIIKLRKNVIKLKELPQNKWFPINYLKHETFESPDTKEIVHSVKVDCDDFQTNLPMRHAQLIFQDVFGLLSIGKTDSCNAVDSIAIFPGMEFSICNDVLEFRTNFEQINSEAEQ